MMNTTIAVSKYMIRFVNYENKYMMNTVIVVSKYNVPVESVRRVMRCVDNELLVHYIQNVVCHLKHDCSDFAG